MEANDADDAMFQRVFGIDPNAEARNAAIKALDGTAEGTKRIIDIVNRIYANTTCRICGTPANGAIRPWANLTHVVMSGRPDASAAVFGCSFGSPLSLPCIVVQCMTCGLTNLHDAAILGLVPMPAWEIRT
jgi:predicted nucleic-acid-binding Zn-ribbon protein